MKAGTRNWGLIRVVETAGSHFFGSWFDLSSGAVGTGTDGSDGTFVRAYMEAYADGWYRCTVVGNVGGGTDVDIRIHVCATDNAISYVGDGSYIDVWGAQVEDSVASSSSYIQTTSAVATRGAESVSFPQYTTPSAVQFYVKFIESGTAHGTGSLDLLSWGTTTNRLEIYATGDGYRTYQNTGGTTRTTTALAQPDVGDVVEYIGTLNADGSVGALQSVNSAASTTTSDTAALSLGSAWSDQVIRLNMVAGSQRGYGHFAAVVMTRGPDRTLAEFREWLA